MQAFTRIPFAKFFGVAAALVCAGGGAFAGQSLGAGAATAVVPLDHYLCTGDFGRAGCDPVAVALPDGTTFAVNSPGSRLVCDRVHGSNGPTATVQVVNEFSPGGATPVDLVQRRLRSSCFLPAVQSPSRARAQAAEKPAAQYTCASVRYPRSATARFESPGSLTINNGTMTSGMSVRLLDPSRLCVPTGAAPALGGPSELLCFHLSVAETTRRHGVVWRFAPGLRLCVPSSDGSVPPPAGSPTTSSSSPSSTSTSTTGSTTTSSTTTSSSTTSTTASTTTTTRPVSQPCPGVLINGVCFGTL